jgi:glycine cleavage system H protein
MPTVLNFDFPDRLCYLVDEQVWAELLDDGSARVGITSLGVHLAGEVYMCRPKSPGAVVEQGRAVAVVELAKSVVSVKSPVTGRVVQANARLATEPELVHRDPYGAGWLARVQVVDWVADSAALVPGMQAAEAMARHAWLHGLGPQPTK